MAARSTNAKKPATAETVAKATREVHEHIPRTVTATGKTGAAKEKMLTAIALSKAEAKGADIPKPKAKRGSKAAY